MSKPSPSLYRRIKIQADATGQLPTEIQLLHTGNWNTPWHGDFETTSDDITQYASHFTQGIGLVQGSNRLPINFGHDTGGKAAAWMPTVEPRNGDTELWATNIEWTPAGRQAVLDGEYRYISPEFNPRSLPFEDPEVAGMRTDNVLSGAALTNIPLFKKLKPVMASVVKGSDNNKGEDMTLEDVRAKKAEDHTDDEKAFLKEHKAELTDAERESFGLTDAAAGADAGDQGNDDAGKADNDADKGAGDGVQASAGAVTISASELSKLKADAAAGVKAAQELARNKATNLVKAHVARGAIKSASSEEAVNLLMASGSSLQDRLEKFMASLPSNELITAGEKGDGSDTPSATVAVNQEVQTLMASEKLSYKDALHQVRTTKPDLYTAYQTEQEEKK